jgi:threonine synthase
MSAYCAAAGIKATVVMPSYTPSIFIQECKLFGAHVESIDGLIDACGARVAEIKAETGAYDVSTLKEPYRLEGKKTMGFEIAEQFNWQLPDYIFYPTGGGTGLIGIWKAFAELMELGWIKGPLPKMVVVQTENCNPVVRNFNREPVPESFQGSMANGLAVPKAFGMDMMLQVLEESEGIAISISEEDMLEGIKEISSTEGITISPEGAAVWKAMMQLVSPGEMNRDSKVLLMNTGSGYKYFENYPAEQS